MGMYAESARLCTLVQDDNRSCIQALRQTMELQNVEVPNRPKAYLTGQSQIESGESSIEGSVKMETTPPQSFNAAFSASLKVILPPSTPQALLLILVAETKQRRTAK
jgi:hypothetical protein